MAARRPRTRRSAAAPAAAASDTTSPKTASARTRKATKTPAKTGAAKTAAPVASASTGDGFAGYDKGTASEAAAAALYYGGKDRKDIMRRLRDADIATNSEPLSKSWSVAISGVVNKLVGEGWTEVTEYRLVPPAKLDSVPGTPEKPYMPVADFSVPRRGRPRASAPAKPAPAAKTRAAAKTKAAPAAAKETPAAKPTATKAAPARRPRKRPAKAA